MRNHNGFTFRKCIAAITPSNSRYDRRGGDTYGKKEVTVLDFKLRCTTTYNRVGKLFGLYKRQLILHTSSVPT